MDTEFLFPVLDSLPTKCARNIKDKPSISLIYKYYDGKLSTFMETFSSFSFSWLSEFNNCINFSAYTRRFCWDPLSIRETSSHPNSSHVLQIFETLLFVNRIQFKSTSNRFLLHYLSCLPKGRSGNKLRKNAERFAKPRFIPTQF